MLTLPLKIWVAWDPNRLMADLRMTKSLQPLSKKTVNFWFVAVDNCQCLNDGCCQMVKHWCDNRYERRLWFLSQRLEAVDFDLCIYLCKSEEGFGCHLNLYDHRRLTRASWPSMMNDSGVCRQIHIDICHLYVCFLKILLLVADIWSTILCALELKDVLEESCRQILYMQSIGLPFFPMVLVFEYLRIGICHHRCSKLVQVLDLVVHDDLHILIYLFSTWHLYRPCCGLLLI